MCRRTAREEGILVGGSSGLALAGALRVARKVRDDKVIVVLLPDSGRGYLTKIYNDDWMRDQGFIDRFGHRREVGHLLPPESRIICAGSKETVREAVDRMHRHAISQMPVVEGPAPADGTVPHLEMIVGVIEERGLLERVFRRPESVDAPVETVMEEPLAVVDASDDVETLFPLFTNGGNGAIVVRDREPVGVITRSDLLDFVAHQRAQREP
jgi:cystathionine beta-synthase